MKIDRIYCTVDEVFPAGVFMMIYVSMHPPAGSTAARGEFERLSVQPGEGQFTTVSLTSATARRPRQDERYYFGVTSFEEIMLMSHYFKILFLHLFKFFFFWLILLIAPDMRTKRTLVFVVEASLDIHFYGDPATKKNDVRSFCICGY